ncbi:MAG: hypothetical protein U9R53_10915, partial [Chloroflexota bacterium]|nr:hypothetical protein [Chloroflexota bacterium]
MVRKTRCHFCGKRYSYDDLYDVKICHECNRHELAIWVDIKERLPKVIMKDGVCNVVLVKY